MVGDAGYRTVMLPKSESRAAAEGLVGLTVVALCETAAGVLDAAEIAKADTIAGLMWGAEDLMASIGGTRSRRPDGRYDEIALLARSRVLLAAGAAGRAAIDAVHLDIHDLAGLGEECHPAVSDGFTHKACIHPSHVAVARRNGVLAFRGGMVDEPVLRQARSILDRATRAAASPDGSAPP